MIEPGSDAAARAALTYGMVGGGKGAFIGDAHRKAIALDGLAEIAAGCFSNSPDNTAATGRALGIVPERRYARFEEMAEAEAKRPGGIDFAVIAAPNSVHYAAAKAFLSRGIHVVCEKPLALEPEEAAELAGLAGKNGLLLGVTYTYSGYPAVKQIRELIQRGEIGALRFVNAEYPQEWFAGLTEKQGNKQAAWRSDPARSGKSNCVGDIGSHIENTVAYMTGLKISSLCARLDKTVKGRVLDDNAAIMVEYAGGAKGLYWASQIAIGYDNALRIRIFGSEGTIEWSQEAPNHFELARLGKPRELWSRGRDGFYPHAQSYSRLPSGHPEGFFEALANIYKSYTGALSALKAGRSLSGADMDFPDGEAGLAGVKFISKCVESSAGGAAWVEM